MRDAPGVVVLGSIAYRGDHGRVFWRACPAQYAADQGCAHYCRSGQPGRDRQTANNSETGKACFPAASEIAAAAAGFARIARTSCGPCTGASAAAFGKTEAKIKAETKTQSKAKTRARAQSIAKATSPARKGGAKAEAKTQEAR